MPMDTDRTLRGAAAVVGVADAASSTGELDQRGQELEVAMIAEALADAGLTLADVDGLCHTGSAVDLAEALGIHPRFVDSTMVGGSSFEIHLEHAAAAIAAGLCDVVVSVYAATPKSDRRRAREAAAREGGRSGRDGRNDRSGGRQRGQGGALLEWELPYGLPMPIGGYALAASRHMHEFGTTPEQLAQIAVSTREWAARNPRARFQEPITIDDVLSSPMVASPLHKLDCCLVTDGAGAFVMTSAERARDLAQPPAYVLGTGTRTDHNMISEMPDLTTTATAVSGPAAFAMAGVKPSDVDAVMLYDAFTICTLLFLEDLGFCAKGEGGEFVSDGKLGPGGALPTNTNGGGLSYTHPGMYGVFLIVEAVRQLRGGASVAVAHGNGGVLSTMSTAVLGTEAVL